MGQKNLQPRAKTPVLFQTGLAHSCPDPLRIADRISSLVQRIGFYSLYSQGLSPSLQMNQVRIAAVKFVKILSAPKRFRF